jgi:hypothetical protein
MRMAIIAMTTRSSMRVKPRERGCDSQAVSSGVVARCCDRTGLETSNVMGELRKEENELGIKNSQENAQA